MGTNLGVTSGLVSVYQGNGAWTDGSGNGNTLTSNGGASNTQAANPYNAIEYAIITNVSYSNPTTTITLFSGVNGIIPNMSLSSPYYSVERAPYNFPSGRDKWITETILKVNQTQSSPGASTWYNLGLQLNIPTGEWGVYWRANTHAFKASAVGYVFASLATANNAAGTDKLTDSFLGAAGVDYINTLTAQDYLSLTSQTSYYLNALANNSITTLEFLTSTSDVYTSVVIRGELAY
jgi:hypothetical protein